MTKQANNFIYKSVVIIIQWVSNMNKKLKQIYTLRNDEREISDILVFVYIYNFISFYWTLINIDTKNETNLTGNNILFHYYNVKVSFESK